MARVPDRLFLLSFGDGSPSKVFDSVELARHEQMQAPDRDSVIFVFVHGTRTLEEVRSDPWNAEIERRIARLELATFSVLCPHCDATGKVIDGSYCMACKGTGKVLPPFEVPDL